MYFPVKFTQVVSGGGAAAPVIGAPSGPPSPAAANQMQYSAQSINGWPVHRVAVALGVSAGATAAMDADLYFWESNTQAWYKVNGTVPVSLKKGCIVYFDVPTTFAVPVTNANLDKMPTNGAVALVPIDPGGLGNATYTYAMAPDLTTFG